MLMGTILLVDDNPLRAAMRTSILEKDISARVVRVRGAAEALCLVEDDQFVGSLLLVIAADSAGEASSLSTVEFIEELRDRLKHVPVLVLEAAEAKYAKVPGVYVSKTKSPQELRTLVSRLIAVRELRYA